MGFEYNFVWKSSFGLESLETWFATLYIMYGLGLGTPKRIYCRVELRRTLRLQDMCFEKGLVASSTQKIPYFLSYAVAGS